MVQYRSGVTDSPSSSKEKRITEFLEAAASLHFLLKTSCITDDDAIRKVLGKIPHTDESYIRDVLKRMKSEGLL